MSNEMAARIGWSVGPNGYMVQVLDHENQPIEEFRFGNNPLSDSAGDALSPDDPRSLSRNALAEYALRMAGEVAERHSLGVDSIFYDDDQEEILKEEFIDLSGMAERRAPR